MPGLDPFEFLRKSCIAALQQTSSDPNALFVTIVENLKSILFAKADVLSPATLTAAREQIKELLYGLDTLIYTSEEYLAHLSNILLFDDEGGLWGVNKHGLNDLEWYRMKLTPELQNWVWVRSDPDAYLESLSETQE